MTNGDPQYEITKALLDSAGDKFLAGPARTFNSIWRLSTGWIDMLDEKLYLIQQQSVEQFKGKLRDKISEIPKEHQQDPKLSLIGPALESTKYYVEDEELRNLFVNLISRSMDDRYNDNVNHAFVEIIKQLSPIDAYLIKKIKYDLIPTARYKMQLSKGYVILNDYYIEDSFYTEKQISISLTNLQRLGLLNLPLDKPLFNLDLYDYFSHNDYYEYYSKNNGIAKLHQRVKSLQLVLNKDASTVLNSLTLHPNDIEDYKSYKGIELERSHLNLTNFGKSFYEVCVK